MDESIYNLIEEKQQRRKNPAIYVSKYPGTMPPTSSTFGNVITSNVSGPTNAGGEIDFKCSRSHVKIGETFGPNPKVPFPTRSMRQKGTSNLPEPKQFTYHGKRKEIVPKAKGIHVISGLESDVNFVTKNAIHNILMEPGTRVPDRPKEIFKHEHFGKIPDYLIENKKLIKMEKQELLDNDKNKQINKRNVKATAISEKERVELLNSLKKEWAKTNKEYQGMTHLMQLDTIGKVRRKERFENRLAQLERDIDTLSKTNVYIRED